MWSRFFGKKSPAPVRIRLEEPVRVAFAVYFTAGPDGPPEVADLQALVRDWLARVGEPLGPALAEWAGRGLLVLHVIPRAECPVPPEETLRAFGSDESALGRLRASTHMVLVSSPDMIKPPSFGLWSALAAAEAIVESLDGTVVDPAYPRILSDDELARDIPADGRIVIPHHIRVLYSSDARGLVWATTKGMGRFGLPELEMVDVPPNLPRMALPLVNGLASALIDSAREVEEADRRGRKVWLVGPEIRVDRERIAFAHGSDEGETPEGVRGWTMVGLEHRPGRRGSEAFLRVKPPRHHQGGQGVWLNDALGDLFGVERTLVNFASGDEAMARAHDEARASLPEAKHRFLRGLAPGEQFYVKHGFPRDQEGLFEYMWVVVGTWTGDRIRGTLANDPSYRIDLKAGQPVELDDQDVYDWLLVRSDGTHEGNFSGKVISDRAQPADDDSGPELPE